MHANLLSFLFTNLDLVFHHFEGDIFPESKL